MTRFLLAGLVLGALTSAAVAQPVALGEAQLDKIRAAGGIEVAGAQLEEITAGGGIAVAVTCVDGRCQTVESRGPIAAVACVNGRCQVIR